MARDGKRVVARSPVFSLDDNRGEVGFSPPEALHELVGLLAAAGWRQSAKGQRRWDLRFRRPVEARAAERR